MDNKQAAEKMPPGEFQKVPEICNCQELKCRKRVDAAIEAMREACARECDLAAHQMDHLLDHLNMPHPNMARENALKADAARWLAAAIRHLKVEEVLKAAQSSE